MLVSALLDNTFLFRLSRTRPFEIGAIPCSGVSVTTHEVIEALTSLVHLIIAFCATWRIDEGD